MTESNEAPIWIDYDETPPRVVHFGDAYATQGLPKFYPADRLAEAEATVERLQELITDILEDVGYGAELLGGNLPERISAALTGGALTMQILTYTEDVQRGAGLLLYQMNRAALNRESDEEGCGAVFVLLFPPYSGER